MMTIIGSATATALMAFGQVSFQGLGDLPGGAYFSRAYGISADGSTVVGTSYVTEGTTGDEGCCEAFRWTTDTGMVGLGDLGTGAPYESTARAVSGDGSIVVGRGHTGVTYAFMHAGGSLQALPELPGGGIGGAAALGISQDGEWIVGSDAAEHGVEAFLYNTRFGTIVGLGDLPGDTFRSNATAISADGSTVVGYSDAELGWEAFAWRAETGMMPLGDFDGGTHLSQAYATSADGTVTVGYSSGENGWEAFRHDAAGLHALGDLPEGEFGSRALGVSGDGRIIVGYGTGSLDREAVMWIDGDGPLRVRDVLVDAGADLTGWELYDAAAISRDGSTITGFGFNPAGDREAWVATLPSCATDLDGDGVTGVSDLLLVLAAWGEIGHPADVDGDGTVGVGDLLALFAAWGACR